jgi:UDP-glucose:(heptosyl)LPS alpha-1,3-glucosyltransferase
LKIAFIVHDYNRAGGHSRYVAELASRFARDHEVHVFASRIEHRGETNLRFHTVPAWRANALTTVLTFALGATLQPGRGFDVIHSQGFCGFRGNVITGHICNRAWHLALRKFEGGVTFREFCFNTIASGLEHTLYRFARKSAVIAISQRVARDLLRFYHCPASMHVIYHGVDLDLFSPHSRQRWRSEARAEYGLAEDEMTFLYVGDLRKGAARVIRALSQLKHGRLLLVSRSPVGPYERIARDIGLQPGRAVFLGPSGCVERVYAAADALVLPTPYDAFAMVVSEAMACGLPVIVSREAGASELIEDGRNGLLLKDVTSVDELDGRMRSLTEDRGWAEELGRTARTRVEPLSWDAVAERTMQVYQQVLRT